MIGRPFLVGVFDNCRHLLPSLSQLLSVFCLDISQGLFVHEGDQAKQLVTSSIVQQYAQYDIVEGVFV